MIDELIKDLTRDEGIRLKLYRDTVGKLTIGVGRNIDDNGIRPDEAALMLRNDINAVIDELDARLPWWRRMSERRQIALANMAFNLGLPRLMGFRNMLAALERGDYADAAREATDSRWARQVGDRAYRIATAIREG